MFMRERLAVLPPLHYKPFPSQLEVVERWKSRSVPMEAPSLSTCDVSLIPSMQFKKRLHLYRLHEPVW